MGGGETLAQVIASVPKGWWWSVGECSVSCDATIGPDVAYCDKATLVRFDSGIMADLAQPSTPAEALRAAIATYEGISGTRSTDSEKGDA
jgi:hypothetical protein